MKENIQTRVTINKVQPVFEDDRGKIFDLLDDEVIMHVGIIRSEPGAIRGNHFHKITKQFNYIIKGKAKLNIKYVDKILRVIVGAEIISGSTRMKSGTATKMILNMISTTSMIKLNKVYDNLMVDLKVSNNKLLNRGIKIVSELLSIDSSLAKEYLINANGSVKIAIIMHKLNCSFIKANDILVKNNNSLSSIFDRKD